MSTVVRECLDGPSVGSGERNSRIVLCQARKRRSRTGDRGGRSSVIACDVIAGPYLDDDRVHSCQMEEMAQRGTGRSGADDTDLCADAPHSDALDDDGDALPDADTHRRERVPSAGPHELMDGRA